MDAQFVECLSADSTNFPIPSQLQLACMTLYRADASAIGTQAGISAEKAFPGSTRG